jgi:hypothetical protein
MLDVELQNLMFALLGFCFGQNLLDYFSISPFGMGKFSLCHRMLEVCELFYRGSPLTDFRESQKRLSIWTVE